MLWSKSYFAASFTLRGQEAELFPALFPGVFVSLNTGFGLWCDAV